MCRISFSRRIASTSNSPSVAKASFPSIRISTRSLSLRWNPLIWVSSWILHVCPFAEARFLLGQSPAHLLCVSSCLSLGHPADAGFWKSVVNIGIAQIQSDIVLLNQKVKSFKRTDIDPGIDSHLLTLHPGFDFVTRKNHPAVLWNRSIAGRSTRVH